MTILAGAQADVHLNLAQALCEQGLLVAATHSCKRSLSRDPFYVKAAVCHAHASMDLYKQQGCMIDLAECREYVFTSPTVFVYTCRD